MSYLNQIILGNHMQKRLSKQSFLVYTLALILTIAPIRFTLAEEEPSPPNNALYFALLADMSANRGLKQEALAYYQQALSLSADPALAKQATFAAVMFEDARAAIQSVKRWAELDQKSLEASLIAVTLLSEESSAAILPFLQQALNLKTPDLDQEILEIQSRLSKKSANHLKNAIFSLAKENPHNPEALLMAAQSAAAENDVKNAKRWSNDALAIKPDLSRAIELKAKIIQHEESSLTNALKYLKKAIANYPNDLDLKLFYANFLLDNDFTAEAIQTLKPLMSDKTFGGLAALLLGEIYLKAEDLDAAHDALYHALAFSNAKMGAAYLLGDIAEQKNKTLEAVQWFSEIPEGPYHMPAVIRAVFLLKKTHAFSEAIQLIQNSHPSNIEEEKYLLVLEIELLNVNKQSEEAYALATELVSKLPNDPDILYSRALTAIHLQQWGLAEKDLLEILKQNPQHNNAIETLAELENLKHKATLIPN